MDTPEFLGREAHASPFAGRRILVVDDEDDVRGYLVMVLADAGAAITEAEDGFEAVARARELLPDLITLDLSMPGQDGIATFCKLRSMPETADIPICVITGHPEYRALIYDRPARPPEGFLFKPVDPDHLVHSLQRILGLKQRRKERQTSRSAAHP